MSVSDAYRSVFESLWHGAGANKVEVNIIKINSEDVTQDNVNTILESADGILVPGGFGERGLQGKIVSIQYARENKIPFLGICLGMQCTSIEFARNILHLKNAHSTEFDINTSEPVIHIMEHQLLTNNKGGTMRLGSYPCNLVPHSKVHEAYQKDIISERHRHRFEFNLKYKDIFEKNGMIFSGMSPDGYLTEAIELATDIHPWFVSVQYHPEFQSSPLKPHPLFVKLLEYAIKCKKN